MSVELNCMPVLVCILLFSFNGFHDPTDNIIATTLQVEQVVDQTTNTIMGSLTVVGAAIAGGVR